MDHISSNVLNNSRDNQPDTSTRLYYPTIVSSTYVARIIRRRRYQRHFSVKIFKVYNRYNKFNKKNWNCEINGYQRAMFVHGKTNTSGVGSTTCVVYGDI
ncbi:unnamed protein product [Rhizophagus irregularis]|uniref:Uncharacterized protein n=1 Tax=Rhizophagus irregularis TaxID=588596 RepID=A0A915Z8E4_9GLOM|nr:unnamed protein product [Rhizophagus irregularis]CAB5365379.1 unnamed protein product [Rhizophagus irregularis]